MSDGEPNFAEFEAAATSGEEPAKEPEKAAPEVEEPVEAADEPETDEADEPEKAEDDDKPEKRRSKPAHQRIAELTARLRQTERDLEASKKPAEPVEAPVVSDLKAPDPNAKNDDGSDKYEFGEADPNYLSDLTEYKVETKLAEREAKQAAEARTAEVTRVSSELNAKWEAQAAKASEKYPDFNEVVLESAAAGDWPCGPILAIALSSSEQGADIAYHLASNPKEAEELNDLAQTDPMEAARRFGRMEARFEQAAPPKVVPIKTTNAPEPPKHQVRGGSGKFEVGADTTDFAAFEAKAMKK